MSLVKLPQGELTVLILVNQGGGEPVAGTSWRLLPQNCPVATAAAALEAQVRYIARRRPSLLALGPGAPERYRMPETRATLNPCNTSPGV